MKKLQNDAVISAIGKIFESKLKEIMSEVSSKDEVMCFKDEDAALKTWFESLEVNN